MRPTRTRSSPRRRTASTSRKLSWPSCWPASEGPPQKMPSKPALAVDAGAGFCYNRKAAKPNTVGGVLKWLKRRDSKSVRIFGRQISKGLGVKPLFEGGRVPGERISSPHIFPKVFQRFTISYLEQYSSGRRGVTRNLVGRATGARVQIPAAPPNRGDR